MPEQVPEYIARIRVHYQNLRSSEQKLADYLLSRNPQEPLSGSVKWLAETAQVSVASVVRFCQALGYEGYAEFKLMTRQVGFLPTVGNITLDRSMSAEELKNNVRDFATLQIQECARIIDSTQLEEAINAICRARQLLICGIGTSKGIAVAAANTFMNINIPSSHLSETLLMLRTVSMAHPEDVVLAVSDCGYVKPIVDALMFAKKAGATTILITGEEDSLACRYVDHVLRCNTFGSPGMLDMLTVTICQLITIQILQAGCLARSDKDTLKRMRSNADLVEMVRYAASVEQVENQRIKY